MSEALTFALLTEVFIIALIPNILVGRKKAAQIANVGTPNGMDNIAKRGLHISFGLHGLFLPILCYFH